MKYHLKMSVLFCLFLHLHAQRPPGSAEFHDQCVVPLLVVPFGGRNFKYLKIRGVLPPKSAPKGAWLGIFRANKSIEYLDAIFACIDRLSPNCTGKCRQTTNVWQLIYKTAKIYCFVLSNLCKQFKRTVSLKCKDVLTCPYMQ